MLVPFENIQKLELANASQIDPSLNSALGSVTGAGARTSLYDPIWGYFTFGQSLKINYHDAYTYIEQGQFTIEGEFTINAENSTAGSVASNDDARFNLCVAKYNALEKMFQDAGLGTAPDDFAQWGSSNDPRCIPLPAPLLGPNNKIIYCTPVDLNVEPGLWGNYIRYKATLQEAKYPSAKVMVSDTFIDDGIVTLNYPKPIMTRTPLVGCAGEVIQVHNYSVLELTIDGTINGIHASGHAMTEIAQQFATQMSQSQYVNMGIIRTTTGGLVADELWPVMALDEGNTVEIARAEQTVRIMLKAKAVVI